MYRLFTEAIRPGIDTGSANMEGVIDDELVSPEAFALAVRARASYLARETAWQSRMLRPYSQLTLLLGIELDQATEEIRRRGLHGAYRWALSFGQPEGLPRLDVVPQTD